MNGALADHAWSIVLVALVAALVGAALAVRASSLLRALRVGRRMSRARRGERAARGVLVSRGFDVLAEQAAGTVVLHVDGEATAFEVRADYLVARGGRRFVAEVKTGTLAPLLSHGPTRRQLLEYASAFAVDGVLLVDAEAGSVREIAFAPERRSARWPVFASGLVVGVVISGLAALIAITSP